MIKLCENNLIKLSYLHVKFLDLLQLNSEPVLLQCGPISVIWLHNRDIFIHGLNKEQALDTESNVLNYSNAAKYTQVPKTRGVNRLSSFVCYYYSVIEHNPQH